MLNISTLISQSGAHFWVAIPTANGDPTSGRYPRGRIILDIFNYEEPPVGDIPVVKSDGVVLTRWVRMGSWGNPKYQQLSVVLRGPPGWVNPVEVSLPQTSHTFSQLCFSSLEDMNKELGGTRWDFGAEKWFDPDSDYMPVLKNKPRKKKKKVPGGGKVLGIHHPVNVTKLMLGF